MMLAAAAFFAGLGAGPAPQGGLEVRSLVIVDGQGRPVLELGADGGGGVLCLRSRQGEVLLRISQDELGGSLRTFQADGRPATLMGSYRVSHRRTAGIIETFDEEGLSAVTLGSGDSHPSASSLGAQVDGGVVAVARKGEISRLDVESLAGLGELQQASKP